MSRALNPEINDVLVAAVTHGLPGARAWPTSPLDEQAFAGVLDAATGHRLLGALAEAAADGGFVLLPGQFEQLADCHAGSQAHMLEIERLLVRVVDVFDARGIEYRVLKGVALSHLVYADPSWRIAADVDLLVPANQLEMAVRVAVDELGGVQDIPELRVGFDREFGKESMVRIGAVELDLHRTFVTGPFGLTIDLDQLFSGHSDVIIGGRRCRALSPDNMFMHACYNVALGDYPPRLGSIRDLMLCRRHLGVDLDRSVATARHWAATAVLQRAGQLVVDIVGDEVAADGFAQLAELDVPRREAWLLRSYLTPKRSYMRPLTSLVVIRGLSARLRYVRALVAPSSDYLRSRGWSERSHVRTAIGRLVRP